MNILTVELSNFLTDLNSPCTLVYKNNDLRDKLLKSVSKKGNNSYF